MINPTLIIVEMGVTSDATAWEECVCQSVGRSIEMILVAMIASTTLTSLSNEISSNVSGCTYFSNLIRMSAWSSSTSLKFKSETLDHSAKARVISRLASPVLILDVTLRKLCEMNEFHVPKFLKNILEHRYFRQF